MRSTSHSTSCLQQPDGVFLLSVEWHVHFRTCCLQTLFCCHCSVRDNDDDDNSLVSLAWFAWCHIIFHSTTVAHSTAWLEVVSLLLVSSDFRFCFMFFLFCSCWAIIEAYSQHYNNQSWDTATSFSCYTLGDRKNLWIHGLSSILENALTHQKNPGVGIHLLEYRQNQLSARANNLVVWSVHSGWTALNCWSQGRWLWLLPISFFQRLQGMSGGNAIVVSRTSTLSWHAVQTKNHSSTTHSPLLYSSKWVQKNWLFKMV